MNIAGFTDTSLDRFGDYEALALEGRTWTSRELADQSARLAQALITHGLQPGDRVVVVLPTGPEIVIAFPAILRAGGVVVLVHSGATAAEVERVTLHAEAVAIITTATIAQRTTFAGPTIRIAAKPTAGWLTFDQVIEAHPPLATPVERAPADLAQIAYTSGVTAAPKGVVYTHAMLEARLRYLRLQRRADSDRVQVILSVLPMAHSFGMIQLFMRFVVKTKLVCLRSFEARKVFEEIAKHRVEVLPMVPTMWEALLASPELRRADLSSLTDVLAGGSTVSVDLADRIQAAFGHRPVIGYGMTEMPGITFNTGEAKPGSVGRLIPGVAARILDADGRELAAGQVGEIVVKAPWMSGAYFRQPDEASTKLRDGWLHTGDLGYVDADGDMFLVGRSKEIIIQGGNNVYPQEVAEVVLRLPGVQECAVIGLPNDLLGEEVVACIVPAPGAALTSEQVIAHCRTGLDPRKLPARVHFVEDLPKTELGKIQVHLLRDQIAAARAAVHETELVVQLRAATPARQRELLVAEIDRQLRAQELLDGPLDPTLTFDDLGVVSLAAVDLSNSLGVALGRPLPATLTVSYPTAEALAELLRDEVLGAAIASPLLTLRAAGTALPIFCMHPSGGEVTAYLGLRAALGADQPLYALQSRAIGGAEEHASITAMAADYADLVQGTRPHGPYIVAGWSMGGVTAHAVAAELERRGEPVALVGVFDSSPRAEAVSELGQFVLAVSGIVHEVRAWSSPAAAPTLVRDAELRTLFDEGADAAKLLAWCETQGLIPARALTPARFGALMDVQRRHVRLLAEHARGVIQAPIRAWWSAGSLGDWAPHTRGAYREEVIGGDHFTIMASPHVEKIAAELAAATRR